MCGRFSLSTPPEEVARHFGLGETPELLPRFNVAPTQDVAVVRVSARSGKRRLEPRRWGLVPHWAKDPRIGHRLINARAETLREKPAFREAFRLRRCLVPADGFYEWGRGPSGRRPFHVRRTSGGPFAIAGLYERWRGPEGAEIVSCTLVTTDANEAVAPVHDRMPVIVPPEAYAAWLDPELCDPARLAGLLRPAPADALVLVPVGPRVNDPRHDDPECVAPLPGGPAAP